jgi:hypothetical protein
MIVTESACSEMQQRLTGTKGHKFWQNLEVHF